MNRLGKDIEVRRAYCPRCGWATEQFYEASDTEKAYKCTICGRESKYKMKGGEKDGVSW